MNAPWTDIGRVEIDIRDIRSSLHQYAKSHEIHEANRRLDSLEHTVRELSSSFGGLRYELQELQETVRLINEPLS